jgi:SAM-dependent methyltransferase
MLDVLKEKCELSSSSLIVDVGSGTGKLSELFLGNGNQVIGVEPNVEMCGVGRDLLRYYSRFRSVIATAENCALPNQIADFVVVGQAFHWFKPELAQLEFARIVKSKGWVALIWNVRQMSGKAFNEAYEKLCVRYGVNYNPLLQGEPNIQTIHDLFGENGFMQFNFDNQQVFDFDGLKGRLLSSSYIPDEGEKNYTLMIEALEQIYWNNQTDGYVQFNYTTKLFLGQLNAKRLNLMTM